MKTISITLLLLALVGCVSDYSSITTTILPDGSRSYMLACSGSEIYDRKKIIDKCREKIIEYCPLGHKEKIITTTKMDTYNIAATAIMFECKEKKQKEK